MLQRAASNACSWWWASHIRTKQSKWLEESLHDFEDKIKGMLKMIEEDGDSFAKRAEMYYKRRPELISTVEEVFRAFKSLADRYDMVSKELQKANNTIGTVFPEQVQLAIDNEDVPKAPRKKHQISPAIAAKIPKVPNAPAEKLKGPVQVNKQASVKKLERTPPPSLSKPVVKSGLSKEEAFVDINKVHKEILALQTAKEFVKSSYETGMAKYMEIENEIVQKQERVSRLQDEFDLEVVIEDNEARAVMAATAIKSCQQTLTTLQEKQEKFMKEAIEESKKIKSAHEQIKSLKRECLKDQTDEEDKTVKAGNELRLLDKVVQSRESSGNDKSLDLGSMNCLTVSELAEKIDDLVDEAVGLETAVSAQTALVNRLRAETDDLHTQIRSFEKEKATLVGDRSKLKARLKEMEEKLRQVEDLNKNVESQNSNLQTHFNQAHSSLGHLSKKLSNVKPDEDAPDAPDALEVPSLLNEAKTWQDESKRQKSLESRSNRETLKKHITLKKRHDVKDVKEVGGSEPSVAKEEVKEPKKRSAAILEKTPKEQVLEHVGDEAMATEVLEDMERENLNWQQILSTGSDDEKAMLQEYVKVLKNYKEAKKKLRESEKKEKESQFESTVQIKELKDTITKKDQEIQALAQKLSLLQDNDGKQDGAVSSDATKDERDKAESENEEFMDVKEDVTMEDDGVPNKNEEDKTELDDGITTGSSVVEEKFREEFDMILDENLDFWLRFSSSFNQVQKFKNEVQDLKDEISKIREKKYAEGAITPELKSEARPHYKHLREIETQLTLWLEQNAALKDELKDRFTSFCTIQDEITRVLKEGTVDGEVIEFSSHQAAKLQGEIQNMKQENTKVRKELQAGIEQSSRLQVEIERTLKQLSLEFGITNDQPQLQQARVPLRAFIFGTRPKKNKQSFLGFVQAQANRKFPVVKGGLPMAITNR